MLDVSMVCQYTAQRMSVYRWTIVLLIGCLWYPHSILAEDLTRRERIMARRISSGISAYEDEIYPAARRFFEQALQRARTTEEAREPTQWLLRSLYRLQQYDDLLNLLNELIENEAEDSFVHVYRYWRARAHYARGSFQEVIDELDMVDPVDLSTLERSERLRMLGRAYAQTALHELAIQTFQLYDQQYSDMKDAAGNLLDWTLSLLETDQTNEAESLLLALLARHSESDAAQTARLWLATLYLENGRLAESEELLHELVQMERTPSDRLAEAWYAKALIREKNNERNDTLGALREGQANAATRSMQSRGRLLEARFHFRQKQWEEGYPLLQEIITTMPDHELASVAQLEIANSLLEESRYEEAFAAFQDYLNAYEDEEGRARAFMGRAWSLLGLRRPLEAASSFEKAYALHPDLMAREEALFKIGDSYFMNAQYERAREEYLQLTKVFPGSDLMPLALFQAAECLVRLSDMEGAILELRAIEDAFPGSPYAERAAIRTATLYEETAAWTSAIRAYSRQLVAYPDGEWVAEALHRRGMIRYRLGLYEEALSDFERVIRRFPDVPAGAQAFYMRGWCWYLLGDHEQALRVSEDFLDIYPESEWAEEVLFWLGAYHFNRHAYVDAEQRFIQVVELYGDGSRTDDALYWAGRSAMEQEEYLRAIDHFSRFVREHPESRLMPEVRFSQGDALSHLGEFSGAILAFDEVIRRYPDTDLSVAAWGRKGDCQFTLGSDNPERLREALVSYRNLLQHPLASPEKQLQSLYKIGRSLEKLNDVDAALDHYLNVIYDFSENEAFRGGEAITWFTRAAFTAARIQEAAGELETAINLLRRVIEADVPASPDAQQRVERLQQTLAGAENI